tara:strand:- start:708 stop:1109 length:402 start_codon:yes stop_codon:yes gene_type:complete
MMDEFNSIYIFYEMLNNSYYLLFGYFGVAYIFLVCSYVIGEKLESSLVPIFVGLYTVITLTLIAVIETIRMDCERLYGFILNEVEMGNFQNIAWFGSVSIEAFSVGSQMQRALLISALIGSLFFFYRMRTRVR